MSAIIYNDPVLLKLSISCNSEKDFDKTGHHKHKCYSIEYLFAEPLGLNITQL